jgi:hypothetical protein
LQTRLQVPPALQSVNSRALNLYIYFLSPMRSTCLIHLPALITVLLLTVHARNYRWCCCISVCRNWSRSWDHLMLLTTAYTKSHWELITIAMQQMIWWYQDCSCSRLSEFLPGVIVSWGEEESSLHTLTHGAVWWQEMKRIDVMCS